MSRSERKILAKDLRGDSVETLYDTVYDEEVEVVEICVGCVYLRWPHQTDRTHESSVPDDSNLESCSYSYPLDGHRFSVHKRGESA